MKFLALVTLFMAFFSHAQTPQMKHPRVLEVEEKLIEEATRYFSRRYPGEPFFVKADVTPLRRTSLGNTQTENLPYFDYESEETIDEWDDLNTPINLLRGRVTKVVVEIAVPEKFTDQQITEMKEELTSYLKLLSFRDDLRIERKLKVRENSFLPPYFIPVGAGLILVALIIGFMFRWGIGNLKGQMNQPAGGGQQPVSGASVVSSPQPSPANKVRTSNTAVSGDVTFHDPLKTMDIIRMKMDIIAKSATFPTLGDIITLYEFGKKNPARLGAVILEMPSDWQRNLFSLGKDEMWLEAYANPGSIDHESLLLLDKLGRERHLQSSDRNLEDLLIQVWRMGERSVNFLKRIDQEQAFFILNLMPKSYSLSIGKKAFPGGWGRLLQNGSTNHLIDLKVVQDLMSQTIQIFPKNDWKILEAYKKDKEILSYLDTVAIEDEKDVYETLAHDSFVFNIRPPFYKVFDLTTEQLQLVVTKYPLDKWALVVMNSSRNYIKQLTEVLDDKKKMMFSTYLKQLDQNFDLEEQIRWRKVIARYVQDEFVSTMNKPLLTEEENVKTA